jgi:predicted dehydrogenase
MQNDWGIIGCAYMAQEYCKVLTSKGIRPQVFSRNLMSPNVESFQATFPEIQVRKIADIQDDARNWLVCTNIESHAEICSRLRGNIYCEKPYSHVPSYDVDRDITILMNRRYYYWVDFMRDVISSGKVIKVIAVIPEKSVDALITQSIHVIDLLWYLVGPFESAKRIGDKSPSFILSADSNIPLVINMNFGSHENFSLRFYSNDGDVYEAKPLEAFTIAEGMEVREPDDEFPLRTYKPQIRALEYVPTGFKPGLGELIDDLICGAITKLPTLPEHRRIHTWMQDNML